jgi:competence protein ComEA
MENFNLLTSNKGEKLMKKFKRFMALMMVVIFVMTLVPVALAGDTGKVNINKASVADLMKLKNIGQKYAERIVAYREKNGPFKAPEDLLNVKGIGPKILALNKDRITLK